MPSFSLYHNFNLRLLMNNLTNLLRSWGTKWHKRPKNGLWSSINHTNCHYCRMIIPMLIKEIFIIFFKENPKVYYQWLEPWKQPTFPRESESFASLKSRRPLYVTQLSIYMHLSTWNAGKELKSLTILTAKNFPWGRCNYIRCHCLCVNGWANRPVYRCFTFAPSENMQPTVLNFIRKRLNKSSGFPELITHTT